ncbi:MAG: hypothetical protein LPK19_13725 [Hymenobacteraceae bacterium]|nr:hypothetical protein [Hymenobacteraceae bacterium]MDX5397284.1 hypothetical protein [Hymenobacteraceae bacterium]MDX5513362.1 hypothetical protein [Hymenobacteraceae bacterium]
MRYLFSIAFSLLLFSATAQQAGKSANTAVGEAKNQTGKAETFQFGNRTYQVPKSCGTKEAFNCCSYSKNPDQLGCKNGTALIWYYIPTLKLAAENVETTVYEMEQNMPYVRKEPVTCYLIDKEVKGYAVSYQSQDGHKGYRILVAGTVDGKAVMVILNSRQKILKNEQLQPVIRQIVRLK